MRALSLLGLWLCSAACAPQVVKAVDDPALSGAGTEQSGGADPGGASSVGGRAPPIFPDADRPDADHSDAGGAAPEPTLRADALIHRYSFTGTGSVAFDAKGAAHGNLIGTQLTEHWLCSARRHGNDAAICGLTKPANFGAWGRYFRGLAHLGRGDVWQRIIDFGDDAAHQEDARSTGGSYLFLSPHGAGNYWRVVYRATDAAEIKIDVQPALPVGMAKYVAIVFDHGKDEMRVYVDGALSRSSVAVPRQVSLKFMT